VPSLYKRINTKNVLTFSLFLLFEFKVRPMCYLFYLVYVRILSLHFSEELKRESEARNYIITARITLSEHVVVHLYIHCLRL